MKIDEIIALERPAEQIISDLKQKAIIVPAWGGRKGLKQEYDPKCHPVMSKALYLSLIHI